MSTTNQSDSCWLLERIRNHGDRPFLHTADASFTYRDLIAAIDRADAALNRSDVTGNTVCSLHGDYSLERIAAFLALAIRKSIVVPIAHTTAAETIERLTTAGVTHRWDGNPTTPPEKTAVNQNTDLDLYSRLRAQGHAGLVLFSSGSTGRAKAMLHDLDGLIDSHRGRKIRALTLLVFLMFDHIGGLNTLLTAMAAGTTLVVPEKREPDAVAKLIEKFGVSVLPASPTFLNLLLISGANQRHNLSRLRIISYGTEPMPEGLLQRLRQAFPRARFIQTFGTSETGISRTTSQSSDSTLMKLDDPAIEHRIVKGELWLRSRTQILGYLNHDMDAFTEDGWFRTGDLVEPGENGYLRIVGREREVINVGGEKVLPAEVESILLEIPEIADCLVHGASHPLTGQIVVAEITASDPDMERSAMRRLIRRHCKGRIAAYKVPVKITLVTVTRRNDRFKKQRLDPTADA